MIREVPREGEQGYAFEGLVDTSGEVLETTFPQVQQIREMIRRDSQGQAIDFGLTLPIRRNTYDIEAPKGGKQAAKLCRKVLLGPSEEGGMTTPMEYVIAQMTTGIAYGKACFEKVWEKKDGNDVYKKIAFRPAISCRLKLDANGSFDGFYQDPLPGSRSQKPIYFKPEKSFVYLFQGHVDPSGGRSAYVAAYNRYQHKKKVESLLFQHLMRFAGGVRWGKYGGPEGEKGATVFFNNLSSIRGQGTIVTGQEDDIEILNSDTSDEFQSTLGHLNSEMARSVLCQFLMLGTETNVGSWALSKDHSDFFLLGLEAIMREMETAINKYVIGPLVRYNFGVDSPIPRFRFETMAESTRALAHATWQSLVEKGTLPFNESFGPALDEQARQAMAIPPESVEITIGQPTPKPGLVGPDGQPIPPAVPSTNGTGGTPGPNAENAQSQAQRQGQAQSRTRQPAGVSPGGAGTPNSFRESLEALVEITDNL